MSEWISAAIGVASAGIAAISAFFSYKNLEYINNQRLDQINPIIVLGTQAVFFYLGKVSQPAIWHDTLQTNYFSLPGKENFLNENNYYYGYPISINNIGRGVAKNISVSFDYDLKPLISKITNLNSAHSYGIHVYEENDFLYIQLGSEVENIKIENVVDVDFILPVGSNSFPYKILLPAHIRILISLYLEFLLRNNEDISKIEENLISFNINIKFKDTSESENETKYHSRLVVRQYNKAVVTPFSINHKIYAEFRPKKIT